MEMENSATQSLNKLFKLVYFYYFNIKFIWIFKYKFKKFVDQINILEIIIKHVIGMLRYLHTKGLHNFCWFAENLYLRKTTHFFTCAIRKAKFYIKLQLVLSLDTRTSKTRFKINCFRWLRIR